MTDWKKAAEAQGIPLSDSELATAVARLSGLESRLRLQIAALREEEEPAPVFTPVEAPK